MAESKRPQEPEVPKESNSPDWINSLLWNEDGLMPVIVQDAKTSRVIMFAWMNREALAQTVESGNAVYWSRSRQKLWKKGEESGHTQKLVDLRTDCDLDVLLLFVTQIGGIACHTGRESCFYRKFDQGAWLESDPVLKNPKDIYK